MKKISNKNRYLRVAIFAILLVSLASATSALGASSATTQSEQTQTEGDSFAESLAVQPILQTTLSSLTSGSIQDSSIMAVDAPSIHNATQSLSQIKGRTLYVVATAYSSTPDQTDSSPFITANGSHVYDGLIAANFLPFHTKVKIPKMFGDKVFTVEDRMNQRYSDRIDVWFPNRELAYNFGIRKVEIEIIGR